LPPAVGKPSELAHRIASNLLMLDYFQTGAFLGASKETIFRRVVNSWPWRSGRLASQKRANQLRPQIFL
jgi:hypothetical protein